MSAADKRSQHRNRRRAGQGGYALMLVFAMAAGIAIMLYMQLPRAAFQAQREKEQLLIERGEQYTRAIQLYVNVWKKYPASLEDLEKTNGKRYLRRRYVDPMTGKDEWKLIKIDGAGVLQNSVSSKKPASETTNQNTFITEAAGVGQMANATTAGQNLGLRRRPSEGGEGGLEPMPSSGAPSPQLGQGPNAEGATPVVPNPMINNGVAQPGVNAGQPQGFNSNQQQGFNPNQPQGFAANQQQGFNPNQPQGFNPNQPQGFNPNQPMPNSGPPPGFSPGQQGYGQLPNYNSGPQNPGQPGVPPGPGVQPLPPQIQSTLMGGVQPNPQNPNANPNQPQPVQPGYGQPNTPSPGYGQPNTPSPYYGGPNNAGQFNPGQNRYPGQGNLPGGQPGNQPGNQPGYMNTPGMTPSPQATGNAAVDAINRQLTSPRQPPFPGAPAGFQLGGGIAGVASTAEIESIKIYNERQQYNEWEFIYDPKKDKRTAMGARGQQSQGPGNPLGGSPPPGSPLGGPPGGPGVGPGGIPPGMPPSMNPPGLPPGAQRGGGR